MRLLAFIFWVTAGFGIGQAFFASDAVQRCHTIADPDARNYCRAVVKNDRSICATIENQALRARCQAEVG